MRLGSHLSIAGGLDRPLRKAAEYGFSAVAMFVRNQLRWTAPPLSDRSVQAFRAARRRLDLAVVAHGSYLANFAAVGELRRKSIDAVAEELQRCRRLGIDALVLHPGSCSDVETGLDRVADAAGEVLRRVPRGPRLLLETTAGAGDTLGRSIDQLGRILDRMGRGFRRAGVCLDTCHMHAAGIDVGTPRAIGRLIKELDARVGLDRLGAIHLNDSLGPRGSRRDRHAHIGRGTIGLAGFKALVRCRKLAEVPMILETPKGRDPRGRDWDAVNARLLRWLARRARS